MSLLLQDATHRYGDVVALNRVSLQFGPGVTAILGPNGAGKSTFMKLATGQVRPTSGTVQAFGEPVADNPRVLRRIGLVPEQDAFYEGMSGVAFVAALAELSGLARPEARAAAEAELSALGLPDEAWERPIRTYSKGMRQRVKLAQALAHRPDLLLLDEPLLGCDPVARRRIQDRILEVRDEGATVVVSSHILPEMERLTRDIAVLVGGRLVARGHAAAVRDQLTEVPSRIRIHTGSPRTVAAAVASWPDVQGVRIGDGHLDLESVALRSTLEQLQRDWRSDWQVRGHEALDADLDSLFGYLSEANR